MIGTTVCTTCEGARWVCSTHPNNPWHLSHTHCEAGGMPCPSCNPGPERYPWNDLCLRCATMEEFMSTLEPDDPDAILAAMAAQLDDIEEPESVDYTTLSESALSAAFNEVRDRLIAIGQMQGDPTTDEGRELHSKRAALLIEMSKRNMR